MKIAVLRFVVVLLACACAVVVVSNLRAQKAAATNNDFEALYSALGMPQPAQTPAPAAQEKTIAQEGREKNVKLLGDLPVSQFIPVMNYFAASMGRRCNFCHVNNNGQWDYAADTKPEKNTAREMIKLVLDVNKNTFKGNTEVGCYTCHRGRNNPQAVPTLPLPIPSPQGNQGGPRPAPAPGQTPPPAQTQASPSPRPSPPAADDIINKYVTAIGGQAAIDKIKSRTMKGSIVTANGQTLTYEIAQTAPDKAYEMFTSPRGTMERAINGDTGWEKNPQGVREVTGQQLTDLKMSLQLFRNLKLKEQYTRMRFGGRDKVGDRDAVILQASTPDSRIERLYFDAETGLLLRRVTYLQTMVGVIPEQTDFQDYRDVDGVKLPFTIVLASVDPGNPISTRKFDEIKLNSTVDDSKFKMPAAPPATNP
jgi:photosynthetic reaction center cytochrome c subunit